MSDFGDFGDGGFDDEDAYYEQDDSTNDDYDDECFSDDYSSDDDEEDEEEEDTDADDDDDSDESSTEDEQDERRHRRGDVGVDVNLNLETTLCVATNASPSTSSSSHHRRPCNRREDADDESDSFLEDSGEISPRLHHESNDFAETQWENDGAMEEIMAKALKGYKKKRRKKKKWCRLFKGVSFTNAGRVGHSNLPACTCSDDGKVTVGSMYVKDMKGIREYTEKVHTASGTMYLRKVQMIARKFNTEPVDLSGVFSGWRATKAGTRHFLDPDYGADKAGAALAAVVNQDDESEIIMPRVLIDEQLVPFVRRVNKNNGYACCEIGRVGIDWFTVRNLHILGHEEGHAWFQTSEKAKSVLPMAVGGRRYIKEFNDGREVGTKNSHSMFEEFEARILKEPAQAKDYVPEPWPNGTFPDNPDRPRLEVPCLEMCHTAFPHGGVQCAKQQATLLIPNPLHEMTFSTHDRQSGCVGLEKVDGGPLVINGYKTALSALGASHLDFKPTAYVRIERDLQVALKEILQQQMSDTRDIITWHCVKTSSSHKAGMKGTFPVYKVTPALRICDRWYNPYTLETYTSNEDHTVPRNLRYLDIAAEVPRVVVRRPTGKQKDSESSNSKHQSLHIPRVVKTTEPSISSDITEPTLPGSSVSSTPKRAKPGKKRNTPRTKNKTTASLDEMQGRVLVSKSTKFLPDGSCTKTIEYSDGTITTTTIPNQKRRGPEPAVDGTEQPTVSPARCPTEDSTFGSEPLAQPIKAQDSKEERPISSTEGKAPRDDAHFYLSSKGTRQDEEAEIVVHPDSSVSSEVVSVEDKMEKYEEDESNTHSDKLSLSEQAVFEGTNSGDPYTESGLQSSNPVSGARSLLQEKRTTVSPYDSEDQFQGGDSSEVCRLSSPATPRCEFVAAAQPSDTFSSSVSHIETPCVVGSVSNNAQGISNDRVDLSFGMWQTATSAPQAIAYSTQLHGSDGAHSTEVFGSDDSPSLTGTKRIERERFKTTPKHPLKSQNRGVHVFIPDDDAEHASDYPAEASLVENIESSKKRPSVTRRPNEGRQCHRVNTAQIRTAHTSRAGNTKRSGRTPRCSSSETHARASPVSPNHVSHPFGVEPQSHGSKRIKSRTTRTLSDGTHVEIIEFTDGSKVTQTFVKMSA